jgi:hypothetical protein
MPWDNDHMRPFGSRFEELHMAAALADFNESGGLKAASDFPVRPEA